MKQFDCEYVEILKEYVGCKIDRDRDGQALKSTQPALLQSFNDEFYIEGKNYKTPATPDEVLIKEKTRGIRG